jgi:hypothetical protein
LINSIPKKLHAKKDKKLLKRFSEIGTFKEKLMPMDGRQTDGRWTSWY